MPAYARRSAARKSNKKIMMHTRRNKNSLFARQWSDSTSSSRAFSLQYRLRVWRKSNGTIRSSPNSNREFQQSTKRTKRAGEMEIRSKKIRVETINLEMDFDQDFLNELCLALFVRAASSKLPRTFSVH